MADEMDSRQPATVPALFIRAVVNAPTQPLITYYDDATGERTELSGATLANWVAKTANLLVDGLGLGPGELAAVRLPPHWQTAAMLLGCWSAGLAVDPGSGVSGYGNGGAPSRTAVAFLPVARLADHSDLAEATSSAAVNADETFVSGLDPMAMPVRGALPAGVLDYVVEVRTHGDHFAPAVPVGPAAVAVATSPPITHSELLDAARRRTQSIPDGSRVLIDAGSNPDPVDWLIAPLVAGRAIVLCRHFDLSRLDARLATERAAFWR